MYCTKCGKYNDDNKNFCTHCGSSLTKPVSGFNKAPETPLPSVRSSKPVAKGEKGFNPLPVTIAVIITAVVVSGAFTAFILLKGSDSEQTALAEDKNSEMEEKTEENTRKGRNSRETAAYEDITEEITEEAEDDITEETTEKKARVWEETETEAEEEAVSEISPPVVYSMSEATDGEYNAAVRYAPELLENFYGYAWVQTTNTHDSSYVADFCFEDSPAYNMLGLRYWQEKPGVTFKGITDVTVYGYDDSKYQISPGNGTDVYVSYVYELYNSETGETSKYIELAIANIRWKNEYVNGREQHTLLMYDHTWVNNLPVGTAVTADDFK